MSDTPIRINRFIAQSTGLSRRGADAAIDEGRVIVNGVQPQQGQTVTVTDVVTLDGKPVKTPVTVTTIMLHKPAGYVVSRNGQGSKTVYELLPTELQSLKPVGRLDKDSSGLLLLTNDGALANDLTHPSRQKTKIYEVKLDTPLAPLHRQMIAEMGVQLDDGPSKLGLDRAQEGNDRAWIVTMHEGRNRQIRRTFSALGYTVKKLHRTQFGPYHIGDVARGAYILVDA
ncbi:MAG TPA: pseudouridine synthase [Candidatus Saccharimonadales bacterium]|nr:pseudouridine synthase [Candidatus Saccharimonadales bacterium]